MLIHKNFNEIKVTFIGQASLDDMHGGAIRLKTMIHLINNLGIKVDLITYSFYSSKFSIKRVKNNQLLQSITICVPNDLPKVLKAVSILPALAYSWSSSKNSDIIFTNFRSILSSFPAAILGKVLDKPVVSDYLDIDKTIPEIIYKYIAKNSTAVLAITYQLQNKAFDYGCKNAIYVPNFVDANHFRFNEISRTKIRGELGIERDETVIAYAGSFAYWEGVPVLLHAFKNIVKKYPKTKLVIMGWMRRANICDDIKVLVENMDLMKNTIMISPQPHYRVPEFLSAFDILCCPKIDCEINRLITPIKIFEFMSIGLPTIASRVGGIPDVIKDGVNGFLVTPGDKEDLERILDWIISNPGLAREIGQEGRKTIEEKYTYEVIEDRVAGILYDIMQMIGRAKK